MNLIMKNGYLESTGGRKANVIMINPTAKIAIGLEILKNSIEVVATDLYGVVIHSRKIDMLFHNEDTYYKTLSHHVNRFIRSLDFPAEYIIGVGIVLQGLISSDGTLVTYGEILDCTGLSVDQFSKYIPYPCSMIHDAEAAATDELWNCPHISDAIFFHIRTNLSGAIIIGGKFLKGRELKTGVFEHMTIVQDGKPCYCGKNGCVDTYCSLNGLLNEHETLDSFFLKLHNENEPVVKRWKTYLKYLSIAIDNLHMLMDCDIILGGTLAPYLEHSDLDALHYYVRQQSAFPTKRKFIRISERAGMPVATGAALPFIMQFLDTALL